MVAVLSQQTWKPLRDTIQWILHEVTHTVDKSYSYNEIVDGRSHSISDPSICHAYGHRREQDCMLAIAMTYMQYKECDTLN